MPREPAAPDLEVPCSRRVGLLALALGATALSGGMAWEPLRSPFNLLLFATLALVGAWRALDRRVRLTTSADGIRYADWGHARIPWVEFSGYRWRRWRGNPYLQLVPRRPSELVAGFSAAGRLSHRTARLIRMPVFAIAVAPLQLSETELEGAVARYLPAAAPGGFEP